ncbi:MAG: hypothetical protein E6R04_01355 [Spirochaetes bacterium]|nr:MAG: hypothetical protein E6R04_01355 [Spirochaetota bacterium]
MANHTTPTLKPTGEANRAFFPLSGEKKETGSCVGNFFPETGRPPGNKTFIFSESFLGKSQNEPQKIAPFRLQFGCNLAILAIHISRVYEHNNPQVVTKFG